MNCCTEKPMRMTMMKMPTSHTTPLQIEKMKCQEDCEDCKKKKDKKGHFKVAVLTPLLLLLGSVSTFAADEPVTKSFWDDPFNHPLLPLYTVSVLLLISILLVMIASIYTLRILNIFIRKAQEERAAKLGIQLVHEQSWWEKMWQDANAMVPLAEEKNIELDHNYDGIKELDNHLPPWWTMLFYGCIIWGVIYLLAYHVFDSMPLSIDEYQNELASAEEKAKIFRASQPVEVIDENTLTYTADEAILGKGKSIFTTNCTPCHKADGGGNTIGPNLTDQYWIHGGSIKDIYVLIKNGAVEKGMPVWGKAMSPQDVKAVAFYVKSLQGTNPAGGKAPQGNLYQEEVKEVKPDTTKIQASVITK